MFATLLRASLDGAVLVALVWTVTRVVPRLTPSARTALWWLAAAKFVLGLLWLPPVVVRILPAERVPTAITNTAREVPVQADRAATRLTTSAPDSADATPPSLDWPLDWPLTLVGGWTFGVLLTAWIGLRQWVQTKRLLARAAAAPGDIQTLANEVAGRLALRRVPCVRVSHEVQTPLVAGLIRPVVLLPSGPFSRMSIGQQRMVLCHELAHVKRADLWLGCVPAIAERVFFFHPLVRLAAREYAFWRESACDAAVLRTLGAAPQDYGRLLLDLGIARPQASLAAAGAPWSFLNLKRRITMLRTPASVSIRSRLVTIAAVSIAVAGMVPLQLGARRASLPLDLENPERRAAAAAAASGRTSDHSAGKDLAAHRRELLTSREQAGSSSEGQQKERSLNYVIVLDDDHTTTSGSMTDVERARQLRKPGEQLIWFRAGGREYILRDPTVLREVEALWKSVNGIGRGQAVDFERQAELELGKTQEEIAAWHDKVTAEQDRLAEHHDKLQAGRAEEHDRMQDKLAEHLAKMEMHELAMADREFQHRAEAEWKARDKELHAAEHEIERRVEHLTKLDAELSKFDKPTKEIDEQMAFAEREMSMLHEKMDAVVREVESKMRLLLERAVANGIAEIVK
jgi:beta-lactamase regulating signal transducer with metallopeptidase domain